jgi:hypothetical protein
MLMEIASRNGANMTFRCIGQKRISNRRNDRSELIRCTNESEIPNREDKPEWGWLCPSCSGEKPKGPKTYEEAENLGAMQADPAEYKDQIAAGFASGAARGYEDSGEGDGE